MATPSMISTTGTYLAFIGDIADLTSPRHSLSYLPGKTRHTYLKFKGDRAGLTSPGISSSVLVYPWPIPEVLTYHSMEIWLPSPAVFKVSDINRICR